MDRKQQVFLKLKPRVKALGFNRKELMGIAAQIADNLSSADDASDEDVNAEIDEKIEAVLPFLQVSQSYANRMVEDARKRSEDDDDEPGDDKPDDDDSSKSGKHATGRNKKTTTKDTKPADDDVATPEWATALLETVKTLTGEIATLKGERTAESRKARLEELLKDSGKFGTSVLRGFERMKFDSDEEFEDYLSEVGEDLKAYNQEREDEGLSPLKTPPAGGDGGSGKKNEPFSDKEIEELASNF